MKDAEDLRPAHMLPLEDFPPHMLERIMEQVAQPKPPPKWLDLGLAQIISRGYLEWYWQRGWHSPGMGRRQRPAIPKSLRAAVYERDGHKCLHCGTTESLSLDHIHPYSLGGADSFDNLQTLCKGCNSRKGVRVDGT